jgi:Acetyltransferases, including N-acetylases of ribosomal proteins
MIELREVNTDNFEEVVALHKKPEQKDFVRGNLYAIAECKARPWLMPLAIYDDGKAVGFVQYEVRTAPDRHVFLKRYMIDQHCQGRGLGKRGLEVFLEFVKKNLGDIPVELMHYPNNTVAGALYDGMGFVPTGEIRETETVKRRQ